MRMDTTRGQSVAEWLASASVDQITEVVRDYGEERSKPASRARTLQRGHFRLFGFSSTPSLRSLNKR
jgi:16S rRNA C1402 N4-methylase RsmH